MRPSLALPPLRWQQNALSSVALVWGIMCLACFGRAYLNPTKQTVFHDYGDAGRAWIAGADAYNLDHGDQLVIPPMSGFRYAPLVSVILVPFSLFPPDFGGVL